MEKRKVNKDNSKNRYCAHCIHWKDRTKNNYVLSNGYVFMDGKDFTCTKSGKRINYWNCCKDFEFETDDDE